jgi:hypothetical protein
VKDVPPEKPPATPLREIYDPHSGLRWLLMKCEEHPGGPGYLVAVKMGERGGPAVPMIAPVIHAGDPVVVEEHSAVADAVLEAVALGSAVKGGLFPVRLKVGGRVVQVRAVVPGRAEFRSGAEGIR